MESKAKRVETNLPTRQKESQMEKTNLVTEEEGKGELGRPGWTNTNYFI